LNKNISYSPVTIPFMIVMIVFSTLLIHSFIFIDIIGVAFRRLRFSSKIITLLLVASLIVNTRMYEIRAKTPIINLGFAEFFRIHYLSYIEKRISETIVALNVGEALVPILISVYFTIADISILLSIVVATMTTTIIMHSVAKPVGGLGIATPALVPSVTAISTTLTTGCGNPVVAYTSRTLIGADLLSITGYQGLEHTYS
jgi:uncharacterized membrane protein